jgi:hypothetical protein
VPFRFAGLFDLQHLFHLRHARGAALDIARCLLGTGIVDKRLDRRRVTFRRRVCLQGLVYLRQTVGTGVLAIA